eukprot:gene6570-7617_t
MNLVILFLAILATAMVSEATNGTETCLVLGDLTRHGCTANQQYTTQCATIKGCLQVLAKANGNSSTIVVTPGVYTDTRYCPGEVRVPRGSLTISAVNGSASFECQTVFLNVTTKTPTVIYLANLVLSCSNDNGNGGCISATSVLFKHATSKLIITNITGSNSRATNGGFLYANGFDLTVANCSFVSCMATNNGGVFYQVGGLATIHNSTLQLNNALEAGGTYFGQELYVYNTAFYGNVATLGAAIVANKTVITHGNFTRNLAYSYGGSLYQPASHNAFVQFTTFTDNSADQGGAIYNHGGHLFLDNSTFQGNYALGFGGALHLDAVVDFDSMDTVFSVNSAMYGGAIALVNFTSGKPFELDASSFIGNKAQSTGGAIYFQAFPKLVGGIFEDNQSSESAGNCTFPSLALDPPNIVYINGSFSGIPQVYESDTQYQWCAYGAIGSCFQGFAGLLRNGSITSFVAEERDYYRIEGDGRHFMLKLVNGLEIVELLNLGRHPYLAKMLGYGEVLIAGLSDPLYAIRFKDFKHVNFGFPSEKFGQQIATAMRHLTIKGISWTLTNDNIAVSGKRDKLCLIGLHTATIKVGKDSPSSEKEDQVASGDPNSILAGTPTEQQVETVVSRLIHDGKLSDTLFVVPGNSSHPPLNKKSQSRTNDGPKKGKPSPMLKRGGIPGISNILTMDPSHGFKVRSGPTGLESGHIGVGDASLESVTGFRKKIIALGAPSNACVPKSTGIHAIKHLLEPWLHPTLCLARVPDRDLIKANIHGQKGKTSGLLDTFNDSPQRGWVTIDPIHLMYYRHILHRSTGVWILGGNTTFKIERTGVNLDRMLGYTPQSEKQLLLYRFVLYYGAIGQLYEWQAF